MAALRVAPRGRGRIDNAQEDASSGVCLCSMGPVVEEQTDPSLLR